MKSSLLLEVLGWAALTGADPARSLGACEDAAAIPAQFRRRLPAFTRDVVRASIGLMRTAPESVVVFSSRYGDLASTAALLSDLAKREILSPTIFAMSVLNAPAGVLGLVMGQGGDHTAVSGGAETLPAALLEAAARLACEEAPTALVIHADPASPPPYSELDGDNGPGTILAMLVRLGDDPQREAINAGLGRAGAAALVNQLETGARRLRVWNDLDWASAA